MRQNIYGQLVEHLYKAHVAIGYWATMDPEKVLVKSTFYFMEENSSRQGLRRGKVGHRFAGGQ